MLLLLLLLLLIGLLVFESHLNSLAFFVQVNVRNVASIEAEVFLSH